MESVRAECYNVERGLVSFTDPQGNTQWFVRFECTGRYPHRYGPFTSKETAREFLECALGEIFDAMAETMSHTKDSIRVVVEDEWTSGGLTNGPHPVRGPQVGTLLPPPKMQEAVTAIDDLGDPLGPLCGILGTLCHLDKDQDSPNPMDLINTMCLLSDLAGKVQGHYDQFWDCYDQFRDCGVDGGSTPTVLNVKTDSPPGLVKATVEHARANGPKVPPNGKTQKPKTRKARKED